MKRLLPLAIVLALVVSFSISVLGADLPVVRQPNDSVYSAADRAALATACAAIEDLLRPDYSLSRLAHVGGLVWGDADFVQFAAGTLQAAGYTVFLASGAWGADATRTWILAGVPLSSGLGYIPVEAVPSALASNFTIGQIAWQGGVSGTSFDSRYQSFAQATALAPNSPPVVVLSIGERYAVKDETTALQVLGTDPDDAILGYVWTISDGTTIDDRGRTLYYTFNDVGDATVTVVVLDVRGARTTLSEDIEVLAERPDCGCND